MSFIKTRRLSSLSSVNSNSNNSDSNNNKNKETINNNILNNDCNNKTIINSTNSSSNINNNKIEDGTVKTNSKINSSNKIRKSIDIEYEEDANNSKNFKKETTVTTKNNNKKIKKETNSDNDSNNNSDNNKTIALSRLKWEEAWNKIEIMRKENLAPVDTLGAESFNVEEIEPKERRFHILVGCLLSSQTKDQITHAAMVKLKEFGLTVESVLKASNEELETLIYPVGFYKRKAVYLKKIAEILKNKYNSDIPPSFKEIENLPGIGPKMTNLIVQIAWGRVEGIAVDVHMHRICNRLGWVNTKTPEDTMKQLESWLPKDKWGKVNHLLVGFGQTICQPINPRCSKCLINNICPVGIKEMKSLEKQKKQNK